MNLSSSLASSTEANPQDNFAIALAPLSIDKIYALADDPANGAVVVMSGTVRNQTDGKPVVSLEYQAYQPMAIAVFQSIAKTIRQQWQDVNRVVIHHRIGQLKIGEISVLPPWKPPRNPSARASLTSWPNHSRLAKSAF